MDIRIPGFIDTTIFNNIQDMLLDHLIDAQQPSDTKQQPNNNNNNINNNNPSRAYVRDAKAMARTPADIKDLPNAYKFIVDMPGVKPSEVKVELEDDNVLVVSGERKRDKERDEKEGVKYLKMERRVGKFMRKFVLPENANVDKISAVCHDGVLIVTVEKVPPPVPKKPKVIEVKEA